MSSHNKQKQWEKAKEEVMLMARYKGKDVSKMASSERVKFFSDVLVMFKKKKV